MSGHYPPLKCKQVKCVFSFLGFSFKTQKGSHEQWINDKTGRDYRKITIDCPKAPFSQILISSMCQQAGISKKNFYKIYREHC